MHQLVSSLEFNARLAVDGSEIQACSSGSSADANGCADARNQGQASSCDSCRDTLPSLGHDLGDGTCLAYVNMLYIVITTGL